MRRVASLVAGLLVLMAAIGGPAGLALADTGGDTLLENTVGASVAPGDSYTSPSETVADGDDVNTVDITLDSASNATLEVVNTANGEVIDSQTVSSAGTYSLDVSSYSYMGTGDWGYGIAVSTASGAASDTQVASYTLIGDANDPPSEPTNITVADGNLTANSTEEITWDAASDPDTEDSLVYRIIVTNSSGDEVYNGSGTSTSHNVTIPDSEGDFTIEIVAEDPAGATASNSATFSTGASSGSSTFSFGDDSTNQRVVIGVVALVLVAAVVLALKD